MVCPSSIVHVSYTQGSDEWVLICQLVQINSIHLWLVSSGILGAGPSGITGGIAYQYMGVASGMPC